MKEPKLALFLCVDSLGWEVLSQLPTFLRDQIVEKRPLRSVLGSLNARQATILSGKKPVDHKLWADFFYSPDSSPFTKLKWLTLFPSALMDWGAVRENLAEQLKKWCNIQGNFHLHQIPFTLFPKLDFTYKKDLWKPEGLLEGKTIFDYLQEFNIPYFPYSPTSSDEETLSLLRQSISEKLYPFALLGLSGLNHLLKQFGTIEPRIVDWLVNLEKEIMDILTLAHEHYEEVHLYLFSDQGVANVSEAIDLNEKLNVLGLQQGTDYFVFLEPTMARFWFFTDEARSKIRSFLDKCEEGKLLSDSELKDEGIGFPDHKYGDAIFLMNPGFIISPNFIDKFEPKATTGFTPKCKDAQSIICSNQVIPRGVAHIEQIFPLMLEELHLPIPTEMAVPYE